MNYLKMYNIYKNGLKYGVLPLATVTSLHTAYAYNDEYNIFGKRVVVELDADARMSRALSAFIQINVVGLLWPITLPMAILALIGDSSKD